MAQLAHLGGAGAAAKCHGDMAAAWCFMENQFARLLMRLWATDEEDARAIMYATGASSTRLSSSGKWPRARAAATQGKPARSPRSRRDVDRQIEPGHTAARDFT